jgi:hypothetical protein
MLCIHSAALFRSSFWKVGEQVGSHTWVRFDESALAAQIKVTSKFFLVDRVAGERTRDFILF